GYNREVDIALNTKEINYKNYVKNLLASVTQSYVFEKYVKGVNCVHIRLTRKDPVKELLKISLVKHGNKIKNKVTIPSWVWEKPSFLKNCVRGLIDTDGTIYRLVPQWPNLFQLSFKSNDDRLLKDVRKAFLKIGFHPSKVFGNRIVITRQKEIEKYFNTVGSNNDRHLRIRDEFIRAYNRYN
ncbi:MAG: LAGLIDADG family homing endonuclease, partial [Candidatus Micrarchaeota archaeon]|nr:LAGLIDADG family homing endonuclease [Candidatus Micrarchaeota archaeon]